jgi:hypothetical protein
LSDQVVGVFKMFVRPLAKSVSRLNLKSCESINCSLDYVLHILVHVITVQILFFNHFFAFLLILQPNKDGSVGNGVYGYRNLYRVFVCFCTFVI